MHILKLHANVRSKLIGTSANRGSWYPAKVIPGDSIFQRGQVCPVDPMASPLRFFGFEGRFETPLDQTRNLLFEHPSFSGSMHNSCFFWGGGHSVSSSCCQASVVPTLPDRGIRTLANSPQTIALETCRNSRKNDKRNSENAPKGRIHLAPRVRCQY